MGKGKNQTAGNHTANLHEDSKAQRVGKPTEHHDEEKGEEMCSKAAARPNAGWLLHKINKQTQPQQRFLLHSPRKKVEE